MTEPEKPPGGNEGSNRHVFSEKDPACSELNTNSAFEASLAGLPPRENAGSVEYAQLVEETSDSETVLTAEIVPEHQVQRSSLATGAIGASIDNRSSLAFTPPPPVPEDMDNVASSGGAVAALVLGLWASVGSLLTPWAVINAYLGVPLGIWGLGSRRRKLAFTGILLCILAKLMWGAQVSFLLKALLNSEDPEV